MRPHTFRFFWLLLSCLLLLSRPAPGQRSISLMEKSGSNADAEATVVVFNSRDANSEALAKFYAEKREIPQDHLVGLACSSAEEISRAEYNDTIAEPLRKALTANFWWKLRGADDPLGPVEANKIRFVVLMRGMPLKIAPQPDYTGDKPYHTSPIGEHNEASVESELCALSIRTQIISGAINNPYYRSFKSFQEMNRPELMLVTRLDGASDATVRRMITDSLAVEQAGLRGFAYIDARGITTQGLKEGDDWLLAAANDLQRSGMPVVLDKGEGLFPTGYPMRNAALYLGWYTGDVAGSFTTPGFRFRQGAVACHIHSFSALSLRNPRTQWVAPLLELGAAAAMGNVYEPYLSLTPNLDIFTERLRAGLTFAESAYASQRVLSWMTTFVGDPLYRPFPLISASKPDKSAAEWDAYKAGALKWFQDPAAGETELRGKATQLNSGVIWEGLGLLQIRANNIAGGIDCFEHARKSYTNAEDVLRVVIHQVIQMRGAGREKEAVALVKQEAKVRKGVPAVAVLRMLVPEAFPQPAAPPVAPTKP